MEGRIDPVFPRFGITGIGGDPKDKRGRKGAFEDTLEKQKGNRKAPGEKPLGSRDDEAARSEQGRRTGGTPNPSDERPTENDGTGHVDILV